MSENNLLNLINTFYHNTHTKPQKEHMLYEIDQHIKIKLIVTSPARIAVCD